MRNKQEVSYGEIHDKFSKLLLDTEMAKETKGEGPAKRPRDTDDPTSNQFDQELRLHLQQVRQFLNQ